MTYDELAGSVKLSEGFRDHVYMDTEGFRTIGWGHKVVHEDKFEDGKTYTKEELQEVFDKDLQKAIGQARTDGRTRRYRFAYFSATYHNRDGISAWKVRCFQVP